MTQIAKQNRAGGPVIEPEGRMKTLADIRRVRVGHDTGLAATSGKTQSADPGP
jgi:hypothetical protein